MRRPPLLGSVFVPVALCVSGALAAPARAAGDVAAQLAPDGTVTLVGDAAANDFGVEKDAASGEVVVTGRNGTTVAGAAAFRAAGVTALVIATGEGDDVVVLGGFSLREGLRVDLGVGDDLLTTLKLTVRRRTAIDTGPGADTLRLEAGTEFRRAVRIRTDTGDDLVRLADVAVHGRLRLLTGDGDDRVEIHRCGFTELASLVVRTGTGADWVEAVGCTFQSAVRVQTADGADVVYVTTSRFRRTATFLAGRLDDEIEIERATFDAVLRVNGGSGANAVVVIGVTGITAGGSGSSGRDGKFSWRFAIVHVFP